MILDAASKVNIEFVNDLADFKMPYKHYGKTDVEVFKQKYNSLSNKPNYLQVRFIEW